MRARPVEKRIFSWLFVEVQFMQSFNLKIAAHFSFINV